MPNAIRLTLTDNNSIKTNIYINKLKLGKHKRGLIKNKKQLNTKIKERKEERKEERKRTKRKKKEKKRKKKKTMTASKIYYYLHTHT